MSLNQEERSAVVIYRLEKAERALMHAKANIPLQTWEVIANRIYYAAYYAVSALLIANGHPAVKGHDTVVRMFGLHFVKTGKFSPEQGKLYNKLYTLRLTGDYNDHYNLDEEDVMPLVFPAEELITKVSDMAKQALENQ
ncbi:MAG: HEPN domain-containing protein [Bacteroidales bacterium]|nr:HEPN domain-containing protein [Alloprevotella sp.]MBR1643957.1 HEPN domain-containing protein [Bacteroidales bacterium]